jgi:chemotaxis protein CheX
LLLKKEALRDKAQKQRFPSEFMSRSPQMHRGSMPSDIEIAKAFIKATTEILSTMAGLEAVPGVPYVKKSAKAKGDVSAIVGVTGPKRGTIAVSFTQACAIALVKGMLGDDIQDIMQDTQDAVGEVANMVSGQARAALSAHGLSLQGATPTVIIGKDHIVSHTTTSPIMAIPFTPPAGEFTVEFCLE